MTPEQRSMAARLASHCRWANVKDRSAETAAARKALMDRWERLADPDGVLPAQERAERAESLKKAHFTRMALRSSIARSRRASRTQPVPDEPDAA